ncbi:MAG TPA: CopG family antitoxin [Candidatus Binatia bacterium]|nr:CopG family antitoxin [Candidatus Binatia bacterium]
MTAKKSRIPEFKNREEEAAWFETHDLADYQDEFKTVPVRFAKNLTAGLNIRLDPNSLEQLRSVAHKKGIGPTTLARMWITEHLNATP